VRLIVQKFGGSSLATAEAREEAASRVRERREEGFAPVVVVSAMGRDGDPYATDTLINLAASAYPETRPRDLDILMSCGEIIAAVVMANTIRASGLDAVPLSGCQAGLVTDDQFGEARIVRLDPSLVLAQVSAGRIPVVAGFQGISEAGETTTLGRGGSDTTAVALGSALYAELVEIYTDVDGIKTADPRLVDQARTIRTMTYEEVCQLANQGARVIHSRAAEMAMKACIPLHIRSTSDSRPGTLIAGANRAVAGIPESRGGRIITGVTQIPSVSQITVSGKGGCGEPFRLLADAGISVDLINVFPEYCVFTVPDGVAARACDILRQAGYSVRSRMGCAKVSIVGVGMRGLPGVMATLVDALTQAGVEILQTADSHASISCLVRGDDMRAALRVLHSCFDLKAQ